MGVDRTDEPAGGRRGGGPVAARLEARGWRILGRNVHAGRSELDIVAVDPGPPARLVVVEVRWRRSRSFGGAEESFGREKRDHVIRGLGRLLETGCLPDGSALPRLPVAIDLAVVEPGPAGRSIVTLYRNALAG